MPNLSRRAWWTLAVAIVAAVVHFSYFFSSASRYTPDSGRYLQLARSIREHGTFEAPDRVAYAVLPSAFPIGPSVPETIRTPVYPLLLAPMNDDAGLVAALQHLLVVATAAVLAWFASPLAGLVFALIPQVVISANTVMTETLATILLIAAMALLALAMRRSSQALTVAAGMTLGVMILTRPIALYLPIMLVFVIRPRKLAASFLIASALLPGAWAMRNQRLTGVFTVSSIEGENLLLYRAAGSLTVEGEFAVFALEKSTGFYDRALRLRVPLVKQALANSHATNHAQRSREYARLAVSILTRHPIEYAQLAVSALIAIYVDDLAELAADYGWNTTVARIDFIPVALILDALVIAGLLRLRRRYPELAAVTLTALLYLSVVSAGPEFESRFVVPFVGLFALAVSGICGSAARGQRCPPA